MQRCSRLLMLALLLSAACTLSYAERRERLIDKWQPTHYEVSLTFNDKLSEISDASAVVTVLVLKDEVTIIDFDFGEMPVTAVKVENQPARYEQRNGSLLVTLNEPARKGASLNISVAYHGKPKDGLILGADKDGKPSVTGDNWPDRVHNWIPCLDHPSAKATVRFTVNAPARYLVVANGRLEQDFPNTFGTRTWRWDEASPISPYCMIIAIGDYASFEAKTWLSYYVPQSDRKFAMQGFAPAAPSLKYFSETVASYPYEKLALIVGATRYGGMENSSAIVFTSTLFSNFEKAAPRSRTYKIPVNVRDVVSHEIAHQWFGDSVTESTWADLWLSEGFATYFAGLFIEHTEGQKDFRAYMKEAASKYFAYEKEHRTPIHDRDTENLNNLLNRNNYEKGAWVLHMLRGLVGDKNFFQGIRDYYHAHLNATASTEDLRAAMEKASGLDLKEFFTRWVYKSGHPLYQSTWTWQATNASTQQGFVEYRLRQVQQDEPFLMPVTLEIVTPDGAQRVTFTPTGKDTSMRIPIRRKPTSIRVDPDEFVLKEVSNN